MHRSSYFNWQTWCLVALANHRAITLRSGPGLVKVSVGHKKVERGGGEQAAARVDMGENEGARMVKISLHVADARAVLCA